MRKGSFLRRRRLLAACALALLWGGAPSAFPASADPSPIKIAVFDFELDDFSAGAGIAGDNAADLTQLDRATSEARRRGLFLESRRGRADQQKLAQQSLSAPAGGAKSLETYHNSQCNNAR